MSPYNQMITGVDDEPMYHLAFLFSCPLVRKINSNVQTLMQLDYHTEIKNIERHLRGAKHEIRCVSFIDNCVDTK